MTDQRFEEFLRAEAPRFNEPPETPREEMWERIRGRRADKPKWRVPRRRVPGWTWALAAAALIVLGFGVGRFTVARRPPAVVTVAEARAADSVVFSFVAADHLRQTDEFLSAFRMDARDGRAGAEAGDWARELLTTTRMMIDSPAADDTELRELLEDLELVLIEIVGYAERRSELELELIENGLDEGAVQLRLRTRLSRNSEAFVALGVS